MKLTSTYIESSNFDKSVEFYAIIFNQKPEIYCKNRWVEFTNENKLAIFNSNYDIEKIKNTNDVSKNYSGNYIELIKDQTYEKSNNIITLNFYTETLKEDYEKLKKLNIGKMSEIMYINIVEPYYYFNITDPDGNTLEICSDKCENK